MRRVPASDEVKAPVVVLTGVGTVPKGGLDLETLRRAAGAAVRDLAGVKHVAMGLPARTAEQVAAVSEGALFGAYSYTAYKKRTAKSGPDAVGKVSVLDPPVAGRGRARRRHPRRRPGRGGRRDEGPGQLPPGRPLPGRLRRRCPRASARSTAVTVKVLDEAALVRGGYGGIVGVGQGSSRGPRLVKLTYNPTGGRRAARKHLALVGKGITFDSGGLSIKPAAGMETMKLDMAGAAVVLHTVIAAARLQLPLAVTGWLCLAENMPSGTAQRPSDVISIYGGKTVEVLNTDAEGRLVMADGLVAASEERPDVLVDVATLTGAPDGRAGQPRKRRDGQRRGAARPGRRRRHQLRASSSGRCRCPRSCGRPSTRPSPTWPTSATSSAACSWPASSSRSSSGTHEDGSPIPWAHLDIAGPAFNGSGPHGYTGKGGTGVAVRTLLTLAERIGG